MGIISFVIFSLFFICFTSKLFGYILISKQNSGLKEFYIKYRKKNIIENTCRICEIKYAIKIIHRNIFLLHLMGVVFYTISCCIVSIYYVKTLNFNIITYDSKTFVIGFILIGFLIGLIWNICDFIAEKRIDWMYIISDTNLIELYKLNEDENFLDTKAKSNLFKLIVREKIYYHIHTIASIITLAAFLGVVMCGPIIDIILIDMSFITNQYIVLYFTLAIFIYKYSFSYYYKTEKNERKILPHFYDFKDL